MYAKLDQHKAIEHLHHLGQPELPFHKTLLLWQNLHGPKMEEHNKKGKPLKNFPRDFKITKIPLSRTWHNFQVEEHC